MLILGAQLLKPVMKKTVSFIAILFFFVGRIAHAEDAAGQYYTSFDGTKIYYEVKGNGEGWKTGKLYDNLVNSGYKVILLDQRGNGRSDKPHSDAAYSNDAEA